MGDSHTDMLGDHKKCFHANGNKEDHVRPVKISLHNDMNNGTGSCTYVLKCYIRCVDKNRDLDYGRELRMYLSGLCFIESSLDYFNELWWGALMPLSVNDRGCLKYATASSPREVGIESVPILIGHGSVTLHSAWAGPVDVKRSPI
jgi:hypothetical protein